MTSSILWGLILALHLLCITYWVGGAIFCLQSRRSVRLLEAQQANTVLLQTYGRYLKALCHVVPVAVLSGIALIIHAGAYLPWPFHLMAFCGLVMIVIFLSMLFGPLRAARRAIRPQPQLFSSLHRRAALMALAGIIAIIAGALGGGA
ncbi:hypothetical protein CO583_00595 [Parasaccharibacter sp. TMW2.1882]|uniref:Copper resistance protein D domain-containing protein n=2 Tax=Acetobacteraceae TaxID=433 RepID=A0A7U7G5W7_9PROT|nr:MULTISPECIES: hypothetical protein [Acetobacteraceae]MCL1562843.1 hypothetical protein [Parasaccharibacter sp. TMW 2.1886]MCQ0041101.1 hypothetical protein [Bombella sp.]MUG79586.1 hypothetical protein [Bombella sp. ESL0380]MUH02887.1 hypothetical protein [Bombella sp. ESL0387]QGT75224.1 hypothetical protein GN304_05390 [Bombella sp. ESL0368]